MILHFLKEENVSKVKIFLRSMSGHEIKPKKQAFNLLTYLVCQSEACFFGGKPLKLMS